MFSVPSQPGEIRGERLGEIESRSVKKPETQSGVFTCSRILTNIAEDEVRENMFYFFYKIIIFRLNND